MRNRVILFIIFFLCTLVDLRGHPNAETRYTVLLAGKPTGAQTSIVKSDGVREFSFEFNDRGRGPKLTTRIKLDSAGIPVSLETLGHSYSNSPVAERFTFVNGVARWQNAAEAGEKKLAEPAFYVSLESAPEELALLAQALLKSPSRSLPLLPEGVASIKRIGDMTLEEDKKTRHVVCYEILGLGFTPEVIWLDEDNTFFAVVSNWLSFIREGWEASAQSLLKKEGEIEATSKVNLARSLTRTPTHPVVFINANLFDTETGKTFPNTTVVVEGNRIKAVGRDTKVEVPKNAEIIDARGRMLMPGLWDMHTHIYPNNGVNHIANGVTTVRDLANGVDALRTLKDKIDANEEIGPRIMMSGFVDGRGPFAAPPHIFVDNEEEARTTIDKYAQLGYTGIKIYNSIKPELVPKIIELAHAKGLRVGGHVPAFMTAEQFVRAGADEIQHINFLFLNFLSNELKDTRSPTRHQVVAERAATIDLESASVRSLVRLLKERKVVIDPTINIFERMFTDRPGKIAAALAPVGDRLPPLVRRNLLAGGLPVPEGRDEQYRNSAKALLRMIKMLHDAGVTLVLGTDAMAGFALHREMELYVEAGIPASEVLRMATLGSARVMKRDGELGSIAPGKLADLILIDGNPTKRISDIRRVSLVVKNGNVYESAALFKSVGVRP